jgi:polyhydroxybutyrate depolymerase
MPSRESMKRACAVAALLFSLSPLACREDAADDPYPFSNTTNTLQHDGVTRTYLLHVPPGYSASRRVALVIGLHGYTSSSSAFEGQSGLSVKADAEGFIVAYPDGLAYPWTASNPQAWNAGAIYEEWTRGTDDVGFIDQMIELIKRYYAVDPARIYVTGHSNGSRMTYRVGYELACKIAAIAPHSGQMVYQSASPARCPVPVLHLHAVDDNTVLYSGTSSGDLTYPPVDAVLGNWAAMFGCDTKPEVTAVNADYRVKRWSCPQDYPAIELYLTNRGDHHWFRADNSGLTATDVIWEFFKAHPKR